MAKHHMDNRANQLNRNKDAYWASRRCDERPNDWEERVQQEKAEQQKDQTPGSGTGWAPPTSKD